jgi:hypothetical protein
MDSAERQSTEGKRGKLKEPLSMGGCFPLFLNFPIASQAGVRRRCYITFLGRVAGIRLSVLSLRLAFYLTTTQP